MAKFYLLLFVIGSALLASDKAPIATYHACVIDGGQGNFAGYQSTAELYQCKEGRIRLEGKWGEEIQNGWMYHTELGRTAIGPDYVGDMPTEMQMPKFQKWCKTKLGYSLCGWNDEEQQKQEHLRRTRKAPPIQK